MTKWTDIFNAFSAFLGKELKNVGVELKGVSVVTIKGDQGDKGDTGAAGKDSYVAGPQGEQGDQGEPGPAGKDGAQGKQGVAGKDGKQGAGGDTGVAGKNGKDGKAGKDGSPDTGAEIVDKINKDKSGKVIKKEHVEGIDEIESMARSAMANSNSFHSSGSFVYDYDLSDSLDGVTKTFTVPQNARVILVTGSSSPGIFRRDVDYTTANGSITFTSAIDETTVLSAGQTVVILYKLV